MHKNKEIHSRMNVLIEEINFENWTKLFLINQFFPLYNILLHYAVGPFAKIIVKNLKFLNHWIDFRTVIVDYIIF